MQMRSLSSRCSHAFVSARRRLYTTETKSHLPLIKNQHNREIINMLLRSVEEEECTLNGNSFRIHAIVHAIAQIRACETPIRTGHDATLLKGIGPGIMSRINDFLIQHYAAQPTRDPEIYNQVFKGITETTFSKIPSIGAVKAAELVERGCRSLADLESGRFNEYLLPKQVLSIRYLHHLRQPVLRQQAEDVLALCRHHLDDMYQLDLVGEYRRGFQSLPDIHIMVSHPSFVHVPLPPSPAHLPPADAPRKRRRWGQAEKIPVNVLETDVIPSLTRKGFITGKIHSTTTTWTGIVQLLRPEAKKAAADSMPVPTVARENSLFRRVTLTLVPQRSISAALLVLTGSPKFEKYIRYRAESKGMLFNEFGLWKWTVSRPERSNSVPAHSAASTGAEESGGVAGDEGARKAAEEDTYVRGHWALLPCATEADIFRELDMEFVAPEERTFPVNFKVPKVEDEKDS